MQEEKGLYVYRSSDMRELAACLIREHTPDDNLFHTEKILVPNKSMAWYLKTRFAVERGIASGVEFPFLLSFFERDIFSMDGHAADSPDGVPDPSQWTASITGETIAWRIFRSLPEFLSDPDFAVLGKWIGENDPGKRRLKTLADQLGIMYDQYMLYRPEWILQWETGVNPPEISADPASKWQKKLWSKVVGEDWKGQHFAAKQDRLISGKFTPDYHETVRLFGFSEIPVPVLRCLEALGGMVRVELYHFVPSRQFLGDLKKNREELREFSRLYFRETDGLSAGEKKIVADQLKTMFFQHNLLTASFASQGCALFNQTADWSEVETDTVLPEKDTALHLLRRKIMEDDNSAGPELLETDAFPSIQIRSCYTPFREVEAVHNYLLHCFEHDKQLTLNDVLIMSPVPEVYAPFMDAVFNSPDAAAKIPVSIADSSPGTETPSLEIFHKILRLYKSDLTLTAVSEILHTPDIQEKLEITPEEADFCIRGSSAAGIRLAWDSGEHRTKSGLSPEDCDGSVDFSKNTWSTGLDRMMLDYAMGSLEDAFQTPENGNLFSSDMLSGESVLLGKFTRFLQNLKETREIMKAYAETGRPFAEWFALLPGFAKLFFREDSAVFAAVMQILKHLSGTLADAGVREDLQLSGEIILLEFRKYQENVPDSSRGMMRGKVTFCGMRPMRSIPAKVIAMIGMNHENFPSAYTLPEYNLIRRFPAEGDPKQRDSERQLFLDLILSAQDALYISYVGRGVRDNKDYPPSACVVELKEYLIRTFGPESFSGIKEPLQAFSKELFTPGCVNQSYSVQMMEAARSIDRKQTKTPFFSPGNIEVECKEEDYTATLEQLISFFRDPYIKFLQQRLGIYLPKDHQEDLPDSEPFFEQYIPFDMQDRIFAEIRRTPPENREPLCCRWLERYQADGLLPLYFTPEQWGGWCNLSLLADSIPPEDDPGWKTVPEKEEVFTLADGHPFTLKLPEFRIHQQKLYLYDTKLFSGNFAVEGIFCHMAVNLSEPAETLLLAVPGMYRAESMTAEEAQVKMSGLLELYLSGLKKPLPVFPKTSWELFTNGSATAWEREEKKKYRNLTGELLLDKTILLPPAQSLYASVEFKEIESAGKKKK